jgi:hypothetical protein
MPSRTNLSTSRGVLIIIGADIFNAFLAWNSMSTLNPRYKTRYKTASLLRKLPNDGKRIDPELQNPAVRTSVASFCYSPLGSVVEVWICKLA